MPVALFSSRANAEPLQRRLAEEGIVAEIHDELGLEKLWFVSRRSAGVRVEVPVGHFDRAEELLRRWDADPALRDAIRCPECNSLQVEYPQVARHSIMTNLAMGLSAELGLVERDYYCVNCHYAWPKEAPPSGHKRLHSAPYYFIEGL